MIDIIRDSTLGQGLNALFGIFPYEDQRPEYIVPSRYLSSPGLSTYPTIAVDDKDASFEKTSSVRPVVSSRPSSSDLKTPPEISRRPSTETFVAGQIYPGRDEQNDHVEDGLKKEEHYNLDVTPGPDQLSPPVGHPEYIIVGWDGEDDQDNPRNWSLRKRGFVAFQIMLLTFAVYTGSAIYTASIPGLMQHFHVSAVHATWGLSLFVLAYGIGPMFLSPIQDMMQVGRNPVYIGGLFAFVLFQLPIMFAPNMATVLAFRFLTGFVGSPALATGGASMGDIFPPHRLPYVIGLWAIGAVCGPITGPVIGNFAAAAKGWQWPILELEWISALAFLVLFAFLPETLESNILHKRAQRLRKLTGNANLRTQAEIENEGIPTTIYLLKSFARPLELAFKPAVLFANVYIGLVYAIFYLWFEAFPIVFNGIHGFRQGVSGLPYLSFVVSAIITFTFYCLYQKYHIEPRFVRNGGLAPEVRLEVALIGGICIPISLFIFGWTSRADVHWIFPVIGAAIYLPGIYLMFQGILIYLSMSYPKDAGSILAVNDLFRSTVASFFPLFGSTFFINLGVGPGSSLLAGLSIALLPVLYGFIRWGHKLRPEQN